MTSRMSLRTPEGGCATQRIPAALGWARVTQRSVVALHVQKRAVVAVQVGVMLLALLGMAALTIDVGQLYSARNDLQRSADAGALAGASSYTTDDMMRVRMSMGSWAAIDVVKSLAAARADEFSTVNHTLNEPTLVAVGDIRTGWLNVRSASEPMNTSPDARDYNAVGVLVRRDQGEASVNDPVPLFFSGIFGKLYSNASASAVAVFDDRFSGFATTVPHGRILPFTIHEDAFYSELAAGGDSYRWNEPSGPVTNDADGIREVRLYPYPLSGSGYSEGDGNFGVLNIGTGNQGIDAERVQIQNGVSPEDFEMEIGTSELTFKNDSGNTVTYDMTGSPGLEATLKDAIGDIRGEIIGFFLHTQVILSGSNAIYTINDLRFGRVMDIRLAGPPLSRGLFIQPVSYAGGGVLIDVDAPPTGGLVGRIVLAR